jgi:hypothetical protein
MKRSTNTKFIGGHIPRETSRLLKEALLSEDKTNQQFIEEVVARKIEEYRDKKISKSMPVFPKPDPPPLAATSEFKKCIICRDREPSPGYSTCNKCGRRDQL